MASSVHNFEWRCQILLVRPDDDMSTKSFVVCLSMAMGASVPLANATPITIPSGLAPGSTYFLTFVTADTHDALSSDISTYDAFVTAERLGKSSVPRRPSMR
jgi:hypothetical protein